MQRRGVGSKAGTAVDFFDAESAAYDKSIKRTGSDFLANKGLMTVAGIVIAAIVLLSIIYMVLPTGLPGSFAVYPKPAYEKLIDGPQDKVSRLHNFLDWLYANGFWVDTASVILRWLGDGRGVGLIALQDIPLERSIFKIPKTLFWSIINHHTEPDAHRAVEFLKKQLSIEDKLTLSTFLLMLDKRNASSFWQPYLKSLPHPGGPFYWTEEELDMAQFSSLRDKRSIYMDYPISILENKVKILHQHFPALFPSATASDYQDDFTWAGMTLLHRAFSDNGEWVLVPYLDLINAHLYWDKHEEKYVDKNGYHNSDGGKAWSFYTQFEYKKDQEILDTYQGSSNNLQYIVQYGFSMADSGIDNLNDYFTLRVDMPESDAEMTSLRDTLAAAGGARHVHTEMFFKDHFQIPMAFLRAVVAFLASEDELIALRARNGDQLLTLTEEERKFATSWIIASIEAHIHSWPTQLEQDTRLYNDRTLPYNKHLAVSFRRTVKMLIQKAIYRLRTEPIIVEEGRPASNLDWALATVKIERRGDGSLVGQN